MTSSHRVLWVAQEVVSTDEKRKQALFEDGLMNSQQMQIWCAVLQLEHLHHASGTKHTKSSAFTKTRSNYNY